MKVNNPIHKTPSYKKSRYNKLINESYYCRISLSKVIDEHIINTLKSPK